MSSWHRRRMTCWTFAPLGFGFSARCTCSFRCRSGRPWMHPLTWGKVLRRCSRWVAGRCVGRWRSAPLLLVLLLLRLLRMSLRRCGSLLLPGSLPQLLCLGGSWRGLCSSSRWLRLWGQNGRRQCKWESRILRSFHSSLCICCLCSGKMWHELTRVGSIHACMGHRVVVAARHWLGWRVLWLCCLLLVCPLLFLHRLGL